MQVSSPRVPSGSTSQTTLRQHNTKIKERVSGDQEMEQMRDELKAMRKTEVS